MVRGGGGVGGGVGGGCCVVTHAPLLQVLPPVQDVITGSPVFINRVCPCVQIPL